jgi:hypothetical protein
MHITIKGLPKVRHAKGRPPQYDIDLLFSNTSISFPCLPTDRRKKARSISSCVQKWRRKNNPEFKIQVRTEGDYIVVYRIED